jgi:monoamine oxidase
MKRTRRDFIKNGSELLGLTILGAGTPFISGCASIDRWVSGEGRDDGQMVTIIGAGLTGLSAALELKKNQVPFRIFEGSRRVGGRVYSLSDLNVSGTDAELGAERISSNYSHVLSLLQELRVPYEEVESQETYLHFDQAANGFRKDFLRDMTRIQTVFTQLAIEAYGRSPQFLSSQNLEQYPRAVQLDDISAEELLRRLKNQLNDLQREFLIAVIRTEWGVEPQEISSLQLVHWVRDEFRPQKKKHVKISGGNSTLIQALLDRVYGIIPDRLVRFEHQLISIRLSEEGWVLGFRVKGQYREVLSHRIICTLPLPQLRKVEGWQSLPMSPSLRGFVEDVGFAGHGKIILGFENRAWAHAKSTELGGVVLSSTGQFQVTEAPPSMARGLGAVHGLLQVQAGGAFGEQVGLHSVPEALEFVQRSLGKGSAFENISRVHNWRRSPWASGSKYYLRPKQFQNFPLLSQVNLETNPFPFVLAGDAFLLNHFGTMNAAVASGIDSARQFVLK